MLVVVVVVAVPVAADVVPVDIVAAVAADAVDVAVALDVVVGQSQSGNITTRAVLFTE